MAWRGVEWRGVAWRGVAWRGVAWWRGVAACQSAMYVVWRTDERMGSGDGCGGVWMWGCMGAGDAWPVCVCACIPREVCGCGCVAVVAGMGMGMRAGVCVCV